MKLIRMPVGVLGARGYAGQVIHALLMQHPGLRPVLLEARQPDDGSLGACTDLAACALALPDEAAQAWTEALVARGVRVLDLSSACRVDPGVHYGIPELFGAPPATAKLVSNPGCYPTATLLALTPLARAGLIDDEGVAVVGCSGSSGAGKGLRDDLHFSELHGNLFPYKVGQHKHIREIRHHLGIEVSLVTQLVPLVRGLMITAFVRTAKKPQELHACLVEAYKDCPWVTVVDEPDQALGVRHVVGTHQAVIGVGPLAHGGLVPVMCSIDNLMRGAASQALHTLNLWLGLDAHLGLPAPLSRTPAGVPGMAPAWV